MKLIKTKLAQSLQTAPPIDINQDQTYQISVGGNSMTFLLNGKVAENFEFLLRAELESIAVIRGDGKQGIGVSLSRTTEGNERKVFELYLTDEPGLPERVRERVLSVKKDVERA